MNATIRKWGNSLALRIPRALARDIHLYQGSVVDLAVLEGKMVVKPRNQRRDSLSRLIRGVSRRNRHSEHVWGGPAGSETW